MYICVIDVCACCKPCRGCTIAADIYDQRHMLRSKDLCTGGKCCARGSAALTGDVPAYNGDSALYDPKKYSVLPPSQAALPQAVFSQTKAALSLTQGCIFLLLAVQFCVPSGTAI